MLASVALSTSVVTEVEKAITVLVSVQSFEHVVHCVVNSRPQGGSDLAHSCTLSTFVRRIPKFINVNP